MEETITPDSYNIQENSSISQIAEVNLLERDHHFLTAKKYETLGFFDKSAKYYKKCLLNLDENTNFPNIAKCLRSLALFYWNKGFNGKSLNLLEAEQVYYENQMKEVQDLQLQITSKISRTELIDKALLSDRSYNVSKIEDHETNVGENKGMEKLRPCYVNMRISGIKSNTVNYISNKENITNMPDITTNHDRNIQDLSKLNTENIAEKFCQRSPNQYITQVELSYLNKVHKIEEYNNQDGTFGSTDELDTSNSSPDITPKEPFKKMNNDLFENESNRNYSSNGTIAVQTSSCNYSSNLKRSSTKTEMSNFTKLLLSVIITLIVIIVYLLLVGLSQKHPSNFSKYFHIPNPVKNRYRPPFFSRLNLKILSRMK